MMTTIKSSRSLSAVGFCLLFLLGLFWQVGAYDEDDLKTFNTTGDCYRCDLSFLNIWAVVSGANLRRANLTGAQLNGLSLHNVNLSRANLYKANLSQSDLTQADLHKADLSRANLKGANLTQANLQDADLSGADLTGAELTGAILTGATLRGTIGYTNRNVVCDPPATLKGKSGDKAWCETASGVKHGSYIKWHANGGIAEQAQYIAGVRVGLYQKWYQDGTPMLRGEYDTQGKGFGLWTAWHENGQVHKKEMFANGKRHGPYSYYDKTGVATEEGYYWNGEKEKKEEEIVAQANEGDLKTFNETGDCYRCDLSFGTFSGDMSGANLRRANLTGATLTGVSLQKVNLSRAKLHKANLSQSDLAGADLHKADLSGATLKGANLTQANLQDTDLSGADLSGANLASADLSRAVFCNATMPDGTVNTADCRRIVITEEGDALNMRRGPGVSNPIVGTIPQYGSVDITGLGETVKKALWLPVRYESVDANGDPLVIEGWVNSKYLAGRKGPVVELSTKAADLEKLKTTGSCVGCNLSGADLRSVDLTGANLTGANLTGAKLTENLTKGILCNTTMSDGTINDSGCPGDEAAVSRRYQFRLYMSNGPAGGIDTFYVDFPGDFSIAVENSEELRVISPDEKVEFYVFSSVWGDESNWSILQQDEKIVDETSQTTGDKTINRGSIKGDGYWRFYAEELIEHCDGCDEWFRTVYGLKYTSAADYEPYKSDYRFFKKSFKQYFH